MILVGFDAGVFVRVLPEDLVPEWHGVDDAVGLGRRGDPAPSLSGELESVAHDALDAAAREGRLLHGQLLGGTVVEPAADFGVFTLVVLAHDYHVYVLGRNPPQRALDPFEQPHRAQVYVLAETAPDRDQDPP